MTVYVLYVTTKLSQITRFVISVPHSRSHTVVEGKYLLLGRGNILFSAPVVLFCFVFLETADCQLSQDTVSIEHII